jgi:hypothetical protein
MTGPKRKLESPKRKLESLKRLEEALYEVLRLAEREDRSVVVAGGMAMQVYGSDRLTADVDVLSDGFLSGLPRGKALTFGGETTHASNGVTVDVICRTDDYKELYEEALTAALDNFATSESDFPVVDVEYLAAMKFAAGRFKDRADLVFLVKETGLNRETLRVIVRKHLGRYAVRELDNELRAIDAGIEE